MRFGAVFGKLSVVMPGQKARSAVFGNEDPGIHHSSKQMDRRIKSGDDTW
jgi:hypothetical protein